MIIRLTQGLEGRLIRPRCSRSAAGTLICLNIGINRSIGNLKFAAGATRLAATHCRFLLHGVVMNISQALQVTYDKLVVLKRILESDQAMMV